MFGQKTQPAWFFDSSIHLEAVNRLLYVVENREPLGSVQGPHGSGRTRVLARLHEELARTGVMTMNLNVSGLDEEAVLWQLAEDLALRTHSSLRRHELLSLIRDELSGRARCGVQTVLLLDDFHRALGDMHILLRLFHALSVNCHGMLTVIAASDRGLPEEFAAFGLVPVQLAALDTAESSDFVRSLIGQQSTAPASVDESAVRAISITSIGNTARMSRLCALLRVVQETSPELRITEETVYSLLTELTRDNSASKPVMRAS